MPNLPFFWNEREAEQKKQQANADALMLAAIRGGMDPAVAKRSVEKVFSAGWHAGTLEENYNSQDFSGN